MPLLSDIWKLRAPHLSLSECVWGGGGGVGEGGRGMMVEAIHGHLCVPFLPVGFLLSLATALYRKEVHRNRKGQKKNSYYHS